MFTTRIDRWWPKSHGIGTAPARESIIEPHVAGRWYARCEDDSEVVVGHVIVWQPPERLVISWEVSAEWRPGPRPTFCSEVEVRFIQDARARMARARQGRSRLGHLDGRSPAGCTDSSSCKNNATMGAQIVALEKNMRMAPPNNGRWRVCRSKSLLIGACCLAVAVGNFGVGTTAVAQQQRSDEPSSADKAQQVQALREQLETLQRRLDALEAAQRQEQAATAAAASEAAAAKAATATIPATVQKAVDAAKPPTPNRDNIHYKGVSITLGGFTAGEAAYRSRNTANDIATAYNKNYYDNNPVANTEQFLFSARQSRLDALVQGDPNAQTHVDGYAEFDFLGAAQSANSNESNSYNPSLRQMYSTIEWDDMHLQLLAGQAWSLATLDGAGITPRTEITPPTIDAQYLPGFTWARQPQLRITQHVEDQFWLALSLENPQTTFYTGPNPFPPGVDATYQAPGGSGFNSQNSLSLNRIPDVILKAAGDPAIGDRTLHLEVYGLYRDFYERLNGDNQNTPGGGGGAGLIVPVLPRFLDFQVSGLAGKGIGRYGSGQLPDVTLDAHGNLQPIHEVIGLAGFTLHATPTMDVYLFAGQEKESEQAYNLTTGTGAMKVIVPYGWGNPYYSNTGCVSQTAPGACTANERLVEQGTTGFWWRPYRGSYGMIRWGLQYSHTEFKAFVGKGGEPVAIENMVFASFRYYPFDRAWMQ